MLHTVGALKGLRRGLPQPQGQLGIAAVSSPAVLGIRAAHAAAISGGVGAASGMCSFTGLESCPGARVLSIPVHCCSCFWRRECR